MSEHLPLVARAAAHAERTAIVDPTGTYSYADLLEASQRVAETLLNGEQDLQERRVAFLVTPGFPYVAAQWGVWRAGGVAVPLGLAHPTPELEYVLDDTGAAQVIADAALLERVRPLAEGRGLPLHEIDDLLKPTSEQANEASLPAVDSERRAMILYTSGTTSKPKGVVATHAMIQAQVETLVEAWGWTADDRILHVLPLHHVHGIINVLSCALWSGALCEMLPKFDAAQIWERFAAGDLTLFMAVPTVYAKLIAHWQAASPAQQQAMSDGCRAMRLMVSGSAALPVSTLETWREISGHTLLERYGMTEIGMALSNPLHGERVPGSVGSPLPGMEVRRVDEQGQAAANDAPAELQVRGPTVFREYWGKPEATREAFVDGWFRTGDITVIENGVYRILGRSSVDIIKTGGYKVSALEVEEALREHEAIAECAVVGVEDEEWGQRIGACVVLREGASLDLAALREWSKERLASYKSPSLLLVVDELPRNAMGKVQKRAVAALFTP
ncbi:MAG: acyl-CoA synthetase [Pirellulaceae bacterium]